MVTAKQLRELNNADPFRAFLLVLKDGRRVRVMERYSFVVSEVSQTIAFRHGRHCFDFARFDALTIRPLPFKSTGRRRKAS